MSPWQPALARQWISCSLGLGLSLVALGWLGRIGLGAQAEGGRAVSRFESSILDDEPFDLLTLTPEWNSKEFRVFPIEFPNGIVPQSPDPESEIEVRLFLFPDRLYRIHWKDIARLETYESLVLSEAKALLAAKQFAPAFEHLSMLMARYPKTPGLDVLHVEFLLTSAASMLNSQNRSHAMTVLEEFVRVFPSDRRIPAVTAKISEIANEILEKLFQEGDLATARLMLQRLERDYKQTPIPAVAIWKQKLVELAEKIRQRAIELRDAGNFSDARVAATRMLEIAPNIEGGRELLQELIRAYPMVRVGVFQMANRLDATEISDWPVRRGGSLVSQPLFAFRKSGPEGGDYRFSLGNFVHSDDRTELELRIKDINRPGIPTAYDLSQWMLRRSDPNLPEYHPAWAAIMKQVSVNRPDMLTVKLVRPHVLPHAFLQWPLGELGDTFESAGLYQQAKGREAGRHSYRWAREAKPAEGQPVEIVEIRYSDPKKAIADLVKGNIEVIDRLFPADAALLKKERSITVESYALPMIHMLVPVGDHAYLNDRDFRRALLYATNRQAILDGDILGGLKSTDSRLISGPFPFGESDNDPLSYAYNKEIPSIPYDPRLAQLLVILTKQKLTMVATKAKIDPPPLAPIRLGVPDFESARVAGQAFVQQWSLVGIPAELVVLDSSLSIADQPPIDLLYLSAALWEPATDAERLLGKGGIAESQNIFIAQVLSNLRTARNWREIRQFSQDLHTLVNAHLPILPLWQIGESFAYRNILQRIPKRPVTLYQDVENWRMNANP